MQQLYVRTAAALLGALPAGDLGGTGCGGHWTGLHPSAADC